MPKKPPFECYRRERIPADEAARMNTPEAIQERAYKLLSAWDDRAERALHSDNPAAVADAKAILNEILKLKVHYLNGESLSPQEAREMFLISTYLFACVFNLDMRPYGERITIGESVQNGGKKAGISRHGSPDERKKRYERMRERYKELTSEFPHFGHYELTDRIGQEFGMSGRRVRDHVKNRRT